MRFCIDFGWIFRGSEPEKSIKTIVFAMVFANFHNIDVFEKSAKKPAILKRFSEAKAMKNREKMVLKTMCFFDIDF